MENAKRTTVILALATAALKTALFPNGLIAGEKVFKIKCPSG